MTEMTMWKMFAAVMMLTLLAGCSCNPGYFAPPYKLTTVGCAPALVPTR